MTQQFDTQKFINTLNFKNWFIKLGKTEIGLSTNLKYINSLENGLLIWVRNSEIRKAELENIQLKLIKNKVWNEQVGVINKMAFNELKKNGYFVNFMKNITVIFNKLDKNSTFYLNLKNIITPEAFVSQLPIIGYFGETLISNGNYKYYSSEIEYFKKGHFVSEHLGNKYLIY
jgi:hypothetical protein